VYTATFFFLAAGVDGAGEREQLSRVGVGEVADVPVSTTAFFLAAGADGAGEREQRTLRTGVLFLLDPLLENKLITKNSNNRTVMQ
jgi:hypothetical protein